MIPSTTSNSIEQGHKRPSSVEENSEQSTSKRRRTNAQEQGQERIGSAARNSLASTLSIGSSPTRISEENNNKKVRVILGSEDDSDDNGSDPDYEVSSVAKAVKRNRSFPPRSSHYDSDYDNDSSSDYEESRTEKAPLHRKPQRASGRLNPKYLEEDSRATPSQNKLPVPSQTGVEKSNSLQVPPTKMAINENVLETRPSGIITSSSNGSPVKRTIRVKPPTTIPSALKASSSDSSTIRKKGITKKEALEIKKLLLDKFEDILKVVQKEGYWNVGSVIHGQSLPENLLTPKNKPSDEEIEQSKQLFKNIPHFLERFCHLKIQEIAFYVTQEVGTYKSPQSDIQLSILYQTEGKTIISEVVIRFCDKGLAVCPRLFQPDRSFPSLLEALFHSSWVLDKSDNTVIRFSDHSLEDNLIVKNCCRKLDYALLSTKIDINQPKPFNFWEYFAVQRKRKKEFDPDDIQIVTNRFKSTKIDEPIFLDDTIKKLAAFTPEIQQKDYVQFVLENCREGKGTLLNLPTGFGKTFIIFMAAAQQMRNSKKNKPYLVITRFNNVMESWKENYAILEAQIEGEKIFHDKKELWCVSSTADFNDHFEYKKDKTHFIVLTDSLLSNLIEAQLSVKQDVNHCIPNYRQVLFLKLAGILSKNLYIVGDQAYWERCKEKVFQTLHFGKEALEAIEELRKEGNHSARIKKGFFDPNHQENQEDYLKTIKQNRKSFIKKFKEKKEQLMKISNQDARTLIEKLFSKDEDEEALGKLFDYCWFWESNSNQHETDSYFPQLDKLENVTNMQKKKAEDYEKFKKSFGGIILDESDQLISTKSKSVIPLTEILLDFSKTFQSVSEVGRLDNPLVIASSATPWPNAMSEFKLHMQFLLPKIIGEFTDLNNNLFSYWDQFETSLDIKVRHSKDIAEQLQKVQNYFHPWIKLLLEQTTRNEVLQAIPKGAPEKELSSITNRIKEKPLYVTCDDGCKVDAGDNILSLIRDFYSEVIKSSDILDLVFSEIDCNPTGKVAFFVEKTEDAISLSMKISDHYQEKYKDYKDYAVQIGFFYNEDFVKKQETRAGKGKKAKTAIKVKKKYTNITFNTNRMVNIHNFNNIFHFDDFYKYLDQYFGTLSLIKDKDILKKIVSFRKDVFSEETKNKSKDPEATLSILLNKLSCGKDLTKKEERFLTLLEALKELEKKSNSEIIKDFKAEIRSLLEKINIDYETFLKRLSSTTLNLAEMTKPTSLFDDQLDDLEGAIFHYLNKISVSNILIFGLAGTSGMRIDADHLYILSGAWTEGKLSQIKGRVGRSTASGSQRSCTVHSPITNTNFECLILRYYIKKNLINSFILSKFDSNNSELCSQLDVAGRLYNHYNNLSKDAFVSETLHNAVRNEIKEERDYLTFPPYEKARAIVPSDLFDASDNFVKQILLELEVLNHPSDVLREIERVEPRKSAPKVHSLPIDLSLQKEGESLTQFTKGRKTILLIVPTRGRDSTDLPLDEFFDYVESSLSSNKKYCAIILFGLNQLCNSENQDEMLCILQEKTIESLQSLQKKGRDCVLPKILPFLWFEDDRKEENGRPPIGAMRNHCLIKSRDIWDKLDSEKTFFFSMDGDTELTEKAFERIINKIDQKEHPFAVATGGYSFALPNLTSEKHVWSEWSNKISMEINSQLITLDQSSSSYYGYPSEPLIGLSAPLTKLLFQGDLIKDSQNGDLLAPFGYHDHEGRRLYRYLRKRVNQTQPSMSSSSSAALASYGPPQVLEERPKLRHYERFITPPPSDQVRPLTKQQLAKVIERLHGQSQHSIRPRFMGSNIAYAWEVDKTPVRQFCGHFYSKAILNLLGLGPKRGKVLSKKVLEMFEEQKSLTYSHEDQKVFRLDNDKWISFVNTHFGLSHLNSLSKEKAKVGIAVAKWALSIFERLEHHFGESYIEEKQKGIYASMETPADYPKKAIEIANKDHEECEKSPTLSLIDEPHQMMYDVDEGYDMDLFPIHHTHESAIEVNVADKVSEIGNQNSPSQSHSPAPSLESGIMGKGESPSFLEEVIKRFEKCESLSKTNYFDKKKFPEVKKHFLLTKVGSKDIFVTIIQFPIGAKEKKRAKKILLKILINHKYQKDSRNSVVVCISGDQKMNYGYLDGQSKFQYTETPPDWYDRALCLPVA